MMFCICRQVQIASPTDTIKQPINNIQIRIMNPCLRERN